MNSIHHKPRYAPDHLVGSRRENRMWITPRLQTLILIALLSCAVRDARSQEPARRLPRAEPSAVGMSAARLCEIDVAVEQALTEKKLPGCVVAIGRHGQLAYLRAFGARQIEPERVSMTVDTVFDLASLTKPIATATSVMLLVERGQLNLDERVAAYMPEFGREGKEAITVRQLLTHQSGLLPDNELSDYTEGPDKAWERLCGLGLRAAPGEKFIYSDVGFIVLGELVRRVSGERLDTFAQHNIYQPLGMHETCFRPSPELATRAAPTERREERWMQGEVHDPRAYLLDGVAGHAGLFSTAEDLALYAHMLLQHGAGPAGPVLASQTVDLMVADYPVSSGTRGLGWDKQTGYSSNRGTGFSSRAFGHGGFTGTSIWIDPERDLFVVFLSNRLHPDGQGAVNPLAGRIGTIAAEDCDNNVSPHPETTQQPAAAVRCGIDVLARDGYQLLQGKRIGLITNHTGINLAGESTAQLLAHAPGVQLVALFSPEHGLAGALDVANIRDSQDAETGVKVWSLYGATRKPTDESLQGIDVLVFDIQDVGARFYTYISTLALAMEAAAAKGLEFVVLDRPNPINGVDVGGPVLEAERESFVACHTLPVRHGMTVGELATLFRTERTPSCKLTVVRIEGWKRVDRFDATGLMWVNPSPNMRSLTEALLYPGIGLLEMTNLSVGRGTDTPFEIVGAPWIDGRTLAMALNQMALPGARFVPRRFTPTASKFAGETCEGINVMITDWARFDPLQVGFAVAHLLHRLYPEKWDVAGYDKLLLDEPTWRAVRDGKTPTEIMAVYADELKEFQRRRLPCLLYE